MSDQILSLRDWTLQRGVFRCGPTDIELIAGEVTTLLGPSGIGKTLTMLTALGYAENGLAVDGTRTYRGAPLRRGEIPPHALYIPQQAPFNPNWRVRDFLARLPWGQPKLLDWVWPLHPARARRVDEVLDSLGLTARKNATVAELSGGEIQRAALAQVFLLEPELLVGDEFISALDPGIALWVLEQCREALTRTRGAALFALHDVPSALRISDRVLLIFPSETAQRPWELRRDGVGWHVGLVHTALCVSRWCADAVVPALPLRFLVDALRRWIYERGAMERFVEEHKRSATLRVLPEGGFCPIESVSEPPDHATSGGWVDLAPIDTRNGQCRVVGVAIPRPPAPPLRVIIPARFE